MHDVASKRTEFAILVKLFNIVSYSRVVVISFLMTLEDYRLF